MASKVREVLAEALVDLYHRALAAIEAAKQEGEIGKLKCAEAARDELADGEKSVKLINGAGQYVTVTFKESLPALKEPEALEMQRCAGRAGVYIISAEPKTIYKFDRDAAEKFIAEDHSSHPQLQRGQDLVRAYMARAEEQVSIRAGAEKEKAA